MRLTAFRLQNYKRIQDTDWIECEDLMVFVGKNESGKTALMRGLSKLNPTDGEKYNGLREFPHGRFTDEFDTRDWPAASGGFELDDEDRKKIAVIWPALKDVQTVEVTRHYSDKLTVGFHPQPTAQPVSRQEWKKCCGEIASAIEQAVASDGPLATPPRGVGALGFERRAEAPDQNDPIRGGTCPDSRALTLSVYRFVRSGARSERASRYSERRRATEP